MAGHRVCLQISGRLQVDNVDPDGCYKRTTIYLIFLLSTSAGYFFFLNESSKGKTTQGLQSYLNSIKNTLKYFYQIKRMVS